MSKRKIDENTVKHIANLAKLDLSNDEINKYKQQLEKIFDYIDQISEMKTKNVHEKSNPSNIINRFREDLVDTTNSLSQEKVLSNASDKKDGYFKIKSIFKS